MREILEVERPWIELFHPEDYELHHAWLERVKAPGMSIDTLKYRDIDPAKRARMRADWNRPVMWPLYLGGMLLVVVALPAVRTFLRERQ